jgi:hypothetical protein
VNVVVCDAGGGMQLMRWAADPAAKYALKLHICNGKFSHMSLLKPFVLKNANFWAHQTWIMHNMQKNMHILKIVSLPAPDQKKLWLQA